jgi:membrane protein
MLADSIAELMLRKGAPRSPMKRQPHIWTSIWSFLRLRIVPSRPIQLVIRTGLKWDRDNCPGMAAALSYYALFSLFPLLLVVLSILGALVGPETEAFRYIQKLIVRDLPPTVHDMVVGTIIALNQNSVGAGIVGFSLLFFAASTLFAVLRQSVNKIWESPARLSEAGSVPKMVFLFMLNKLVAYLLVLATALLLLASFVANILIRAVVEMVNHFQETVPFIQQVDELLLTRGLQVSTSVFILSLTLCILFKLLPTVRPQWRDVWLGAVITAVMLVGLQQFATGGVVSVFSKFLSYGVIGSVMILMLWIFLACQIVFVGCEFSYVYAHLYGSRRSTVT